MIKVESQYSSLSNSLLRILDSKSCGLLEVSTYKVCTPLIVMITQDLTDRDILVAFCVDQPNNSDAKDNIYTTFREKLEENIKYGRVKNLVQQMLEERKSLNQLEGDQNTNGTQLLVESFEHSSQTNENQSIEILKDQILKDRVIDVFKRDHNMSSVQKHSLGSPLPVNQEESLDIQIFICKDLARWDTLMAGTKLSCGVMFLSRESDGMEFLLFSPISSNLQTVVQENNCKLQIHHSPGEDHTIKVEGSTNLPQTVYCMSNVECVENHFFKIGTQTEMCSNSIVDSETFKNILENYEVKHKSRIIVISKLNSVNPHIFCSVDPIKTWERAESTEEKLEESRKRYHHNPDEIIDGRPKWSSIKVLRPGVEPEETLDFDRLNPHRSFVAEFEDEFDNTDWRYNKTVLRMTADLGCETTVTLGDSRLTIEDDKKYLEEYWEWQNRKRELSQFSPQVRLKKMKTDKMVKIRKSRIISKILRKNFLYS